MKYRKYSIIPAPIKKSRSTKPAFKVLVDKDTVINVVCDHFNVSMSDIDNESRKRPYPYVRHIIMSFLKELSLPTLTQVGNVFHRDHTTVMSSIITLRDWYDTDDVIKKEVEYLKERVLSVN